MDSDHISIINQAFEDADVLTVCGTLGEHIKHHGINRPALAESIGVSRSALHKILSAEGNPTLSNFLILLKELNLILEVRPHSFNLTPLERE